MGPRGLLLASVVLGVSIHAHATTEIVGEKAVRSNPSDYPSTCFLTITERDGDEESVSGCSGTLIGGNKIVTAGHCFNQNFSINRSDVSVRCAGGAMGRVTQVVLPDPSSWVYNSTSGKYVPRTNLDVATVTLKATSTLPTVAVEKTLEEFFKDEMSDRGLPLKDGVQCYVAGYGINPRGSTGVLYTAHLGSELIHFKDGVIQITEVDGSRLKTSVDHGDSGGSLICEGPGLPKTLIGVTVSIGLDEQTHQRTRNYFAPTWINHL